MPWLFSTEDAVDRASPWYTLFQKNLIQRTQPSRASQSFDKLMHRHPIQSKDLADIIIGFRSAYGKIDDPLFFDYVEALLKSKSLEPSDLLLVLLNHSPYGVGRSTKPKRLQKHGMPTCEERLFTVILSTEFPTSVNGILGLVFAIFRWLSVINEYEMTQQLNVGALHAVDNFTAGAYEALGTLAITVLSSKALTGVAKTRWWRERRAKMIVDMENFDSHILQWIQTPLAGRLRALIDAVPFVEVDKQGRPKFTDRQLLLAVPEQSIVYSRAGLFIWLNAALCGRPLIDDMNLLGYLQARYPGDMQSLMIDLLAASFDVLTNAMLRKESRQNVKIIRSFICNKIPLLMMLLTPSIPAPATVESYVQLAFAQAISMDPLPPITPGATDIRDSLKNTRLEFLQACALHTLVSENVIAEILQEPIALPRVTKYTKESLIVQCSSNSSRLESYIDDLDGFQGNTGAIATCVTQMLVNLSASKDTMALKSLCNKLVKKFAKMDIVVQYAPPSTFLPSVCIVLNDWIHDQDQTEYTPAYEEFASILLFVLGMVQRYDLDRTDLGVAGGSFVANLMEAMTASKPTSDLTPEQTSQLAQWIEGLFTVDEHGDTPGIGDEIMKNCSPQAFYQLVPTLFEQSVLGCLSHALPIKAFKIGLELLLEPSLLPSIVIGLGWLSEHAWEDHNDIDIILQVIEKIVRLTSTSQDTQAMHRTVLSIMADPVCAALQETLRRKPNKKRATELFEVLKVHANRRPNVRCSRAEIESWISSDQSVQSHVERITRELISWATNPSHPPNPPPKYSHRDLDTACQLLSGEQLLTAMISQLQTTPLSSLPIALDVCTAMICSPLTMPSAGQTVSLFYKNTVKLRDTIQLTVSRLSVQSDKPQLEVEAIIQLGRSVANQLAVVPVPPNVMPLQNPEQQAADQIMQDIALELTGDAAAALGADAAAIAQNTDLTGLDPTMDLNNASAEQLAALTATDATAMELDSQQIFGDMGLTMDAATLEAQASGLGDQEEDIFAGLDDMGGLEDDFNFG